MKTKINAKKGIYNSSKLALHPEKIKSLKKEEITSPVYVRVKPTNKCNHKCFYCSYDPINECSVTEIFNREDEIPREKMLEILSDFKDIRDSDPRHIGVWSLTYSGGGEPLVYPYISEMMKKTLEYKIDLSIITNGQRLNGERAEVLSQAEWVRVSANSCDAKTFEKIRRIPEKFFYELKDNLSNFAKIKKPDCEFGVDFVILKENHDQIYEITKFFKELGLNNVKFSPMWDAKDFHGYHAPFKQKVIEQIARAKENLEGNGFILYNNYEGHFKLGGVSERKYNRCFMMEVQPVIAADCNVYTCQDKAYSESGFLGSIKDRSFKDLWFSDEFNKKVRDFDIKQNCRHHCSKDARNLSIIDMVNNIDNLDKYKPESEKHKNFI